MKNKPIKSEHFPGVDKATRPATNIYHPQPATPAHERRPYRTLDDVLDYVCIGSLSTFLKKEIPKDVQSMLVEKANRHREKLLHQPSNN